MNRSGKGHLGRGRAGWASLALIGLACGLGCPGWGSAPHYDRLWAYLDGQERLHLLAVRRVETEGGPGSPTLRYFPVESSPKLEVELPLPPGTVGFGFALDPQGRAVVINGSLFYRFDGKQFSQLGVAPGAACPDGAPDPYQRFERGVGAWADEGGVRILAQASEYGWDQYAVYALAADQVDGCTSLTLPGGYSGPAALDLSAPDPLALLADADGVLSPFVLQDDGAGHAFQPVSGVWGASQLGLDPLLTHSGDGRPVLISRGTGYGVFWPGGSDELPGAPSSIETLAAAPRPGGGFAVAMGQPDGGVRVFLYDAAGARTEQAIAIEGNHLRALALAARAEADRGEVIHLLTIEQATRFRDYRLSPAAGLTEVVDLR